ncbi:Protein of unknown function [Austwickia chelonae]|uniref:DUF3253 domain-containing protein n=1 Tax=Austwickia chelonae NBRC 105200 TaxID=1184607 RepID=K6VR77_9MICO|nr:DUF3253 domain-containing protein [Austwickia chelonae]GAB77865.1 hypothetical protein AUCHE_08_01070 [Austwickia chelonae NBRC 105200]SEV91118.1 Protein of unknown function [Austwickia chelonae]
MVDKTPDGRHIVVGGRRWRATDPAIPDALRTELVAELMQARRLVRTDPTSARPRVSDAKVALGERGEPWWEPPTRQGQSDRAAAAIRALLRRRAEGTICPSEIARIIGGTDWRESLDLVREVARELAAADIVRIQQKGLVVDPAKTRGPIRIGPGDRLTPPEPRTTEKATPTDTQPRTPTGEDVADKTAADADGRPSD